MPIYEYRRPDGTTFEIQQSFSDEALATDPETGVPVERVLHAPAVHFKGTGFYNTDYGTRKRNRETLAAAEGGSSEKGAGSDSKGADSSGAASGESAPASKPTESSTPSPPARKDGGEAPANKRPPAKRPNPGRGRRAPGT